MHAKLPSMQSVFLLLMIGFIIAISTDCMLQQFILLDIFHQMCLSTVQRKKTIMNAMQ